MTTQPAAFLLRYQGPAALGPGESGEGTLTKTATRESSDQDVSRDWLATATQTHTESREQSDQDPAHLALGTQTRTDSRESSDNDPGRAGWAIIPRA
jgi:hypothetical protein